ncbi:MAG TPA: S41 family peptidase [Gemmataceae bacterium]|nr:S41 family peptidase [Gemmataceae bacterium]
MEHRRSLLQLASIVTVLFGMTLLAPPLTGAVFETSDTLAQLQAQAMQWQEAGQWTRAADLWYEVLIRDRSVADVKKNHQYCLRRAQQLARHQDSSYRQQVLTMSLENALQHYGEVLAKLQADYVDPSKVQLPLLFKQGLDELSFALSEEMRQAYFSEVPSEAVAVFRSELQNTWADKPVRKPSDAQNLARDLALAAKRDLGLKPSLVVLELACGACNALDECTFYLTPRQFSELNASLKGETAGIGAELNITADGVFVSQVLPGSPAQQNDLLYGDRILRIDGKSGLALAEAAVELLRGEPGTTVEIEAQTGKKEPRVLKLKRQVVRLASVSEPRFLDLAQGIGYLQLLAFQESTVEELNLAIEKLQAQGMRALILDLRGNPGGLFDVARQVVERFVSAGVIVSTQGRVAGDYNTTYHAHGMNILAVPLVVLVDGETASSAEMVAGALKDNLRGKLVGKTTFGKGSIQKIKTLNSAQTGIRMTVARFYSPRQQSYDGRGVAPHLDIELRPSMSMSMEMDNQVQAALEVARSLILGHGAEGGVR